MNLFLSLANEVPAGTRPPDTVNKAVYPEAGVPQTKGGHNLPHSAPWYRQEKWRIVMLVAAIVVIGAVVGGVVGFVIGSKDKTRNSTPQNGTEPSAVNLPLPTSTVTIPASVVVLPPSTATLPPSTVSLPTSTNTNPWHSSTCWNQWHCHARGL